MIGNNKSGMLDSILAAMLKKKKQMEAGLQGVGKAWAADTSNKQKAADGGKWWPKG